MKERNKRSSVTLGDSVLDSQAAIFRGTIHTQPRYIVYATQQIVDRRKKDQMLNERTQQTY